MLNHCLRLACLLIAALVAVQWPVTAGAQADRTTRGFVWEATRGKDRVLLLGSIHVGRPEFANLSATELPPLIQAEVIAFEANVFDAQASATAAERWAMYPAGGPGLEAQLDAATLARIEKVVARTGFSLPLCCRMKPWMVANTLVVLEAAGAGLSPAYGSEALLYQFAMTRGRPLVEIESVDEQLRMFDDATPGVQVDYLRSTLQTIEDGTARADIERLVSAWERGDAAAMELLLDEMSRSNRASKQYIAERLVRGRHPKMMAAIERFAGSGRLHLVAIGALHFFGRDGLLQLLRERGFTVRRLP